MRTTWSFGSQLHVSPLGCREFASQRTSEERISEERTSEERISEERTSEEPASEDPRLLPCSSEY
jgi:hypothetical protein